jgi:hypothetical protein
MGYPGVEVATMPMQEVFLEEVMNGRTFRVLKTYDSRFAHEAFGEMSGEALEALAASLDLKSKFDDFDIPASADVDYADFLWEEVLESAREEGSTLSFFVVSETEQRAARNLYVSPDWPSAESFLKLQLTNIGKDS